MASGELLSCLAEQAERYLRVLRPLAFMGDHPGKESCSERGD